ncbi:SDR family oxidoreductase [Cohnella lupini]|uniref:NAD(P)-dependent dehydrogenase (Short-subunit alcohol dehydrogenase family) n=1 Tax=Cohnella lupini TaxID=1294267 RepID=A0A3D9IS83_9BACL|nr:SDR family oxidoreductase [Cohnella lupini]RED64661.1 NAD(P)-dependent dehydrogenase (short-subunit alcohol dehydrogenase family) [Cohnella lupini]
MNILITGAGRGLGFQLTKLAVERGHQVIACVRDIGDHSENLPALAKGFPELLRIERMNVTREDDVAELAKKLSGESVKLDGIINNAGVLLAREHKIGTLPIDQLLLTFEVNLFGPMIVLKHLTSLLTDDAGANVVNISSEAGSFAGAYGGDYPYAISKAAVNMLSKQLNEELRPRGIRVLAVHPGWIRTDMGGDKAPMEASESASGILDILERKTIVSEEAFFVDHRGRQMSL